MVELTNMEGATRTRSTASSGNLTLKDIFTQCQEKKQSHNRLLEHTKKLYQSTPFADFCDEFESYLLLALQAQEDYHANIVLEFVAKFAIGLYVPPENKENDVNGSINSACSDLDESARVIENPFLVRLMKYLLQYYDVVNVPFRLHAVKLLHLLLTDMNTDSSIDDELFESLTEALLVCLKDKVSAIRVAAVLALFRLQDPTNKECPVTKQYLQHLKLDPNSQVREAVLSVIGATTITLESVIDRTRDEKDKVRKRAYEYLAEKVHIKALTISRRVRLLKEGLQDRSELVKTCVASTLVPTWLKMCGGSIVTFLRCLDVGIQETEESLNVTKLALDAILDNITMEKAVNDFIKTLTAEKQIPPEELSCENAFYWLYLIKHLKKQDAEDGESFLEQMQPELIQYCQYIKSYITTVHSTWDLNQKLDHQFICEQLLEIASNYDLADMAGSQRLNAVVNDILVSSSCSASLVKPLISCIIKTKLDPEERLVMVAEMISNIKEPILTMEFEVSEEERKQARLKIAKIRVELNELNENLKNYAENEEFAKAQETKEQIQHLEAEKVTLEKSLMPSTREVRTEKNDTDTLLKCMTMITELMLQAPLKKMSPTLENLLTTLLMPGVQHPDPAVRRQGVLGVGLCSIISVAIANQNFSLYLQISQMDHPMIQLMALKVIFDLLHMHGLEMFQPPETADDSNDALDLMNAESSPHGEGRAQTVTNVVTILKSHLDSKIDDIRAVTAQGLGKLLLLGHIYSSELLSHMILLWFNPTTDSNSLLLHFLGVFIPTYAARGRRGKQCFEEAFLPTIKTVLDAPHTSPLSRINVVHMAKLILQLIQPINNGDETTIRSNEPELDVQESKPHDRLAEKICIEILKDPDNSLSNQKLSQIMTTLYLSSTCLPVHKNISTLVTKLKKRVRDRLTLRNIDTFTNIIKAIIDSELTINGDNTQGSQNDIESVDSQSIVEANTIVPESDLSTESSQPSPAKQMRLQEDRNLDNGTSKKKEDTVKKGRPERNELPQSHPKSKETAVSDLMLTRSQRKIFEKEATVKLVRLPQRKSKRTALSFTTTDSDSDVTLIQKGASNKHKNTGASSLTNVDGEIEAQSKPSKPSGANKDQQLGSKELPTLTERRTRPRSSKGSSSESLTRLLNKSQERATGAATRSHAGPTTKRNKERAIRVANRSHDGPPRAANKSLERARRAANRSHDGSPRATNRSLERARRAANRSHAGPPRATNKSLERARRAANRSHDGSPSATNKSLERARRAANRSHDGSPRATNRSQEQARRAANRSHEATNRNQGHTRGSNVNHDRNTNNSQDERGTRAISKSQGERATSMVIRNQGVQTIRSSNKSPGKTPGGKSPSVVRTPTKTPVRRQKRVSGLNDKTDNESADESSSGGDDSRVLTRSNNKRPEMKSPTRSSARRNSKSLRNQSNKSANNIVESTVNQRSVRAAVDSHLHGMIKGALNRLKSRSSQRLRTDSESNSSQSSSRPSSARRIPSPTKLLKVPIVNLEKVAGNQESVNRKTRYGNKDDHHKSESTPKHANSNETYAKHRRMRKPNESPIGDTSRDSESASPRPKRSFLSNSDKEIRTSKRTIHKPARYVEFSDDSISAKSPGRSSSTSQSSTPKRMSTRSNNRKASLTELESDSSKSSPTRLGKSKMSTVDGKAEKPRRRIPPSQTESDSSSPKTKTRLSLSRNAESSAVSKSTSVSRQGRKSDSSPVSPTSPRKTRSQWSSASKSIPPSERRSKELSPLRSGSKSRKNTKLVATNQSTDDDSSRLRLSSSDESDTEWSITRRGF